MALPTPHSSFNFCIRDANGQTQMVKVVQATQSVGGQIQIPSSAMKTLFKSPSTSEGGTICRSVNISGIKGVPAAKIQKTTLESMAKVTIPKKVQSVAITDPTKIIRTVPTLVHQVPKQNPQPVPIKVDPEKNYFSKNAILGYSGRKRQEPENEIRIDYSSKRRRMVEKVGKGLRHFSMKVCEKVRKKGFTSYNEVADELVAEFTEGLNACPDNQHYDQKNIRRRVYDALNVLMAMNIISKEKKEIRWLGLPTNTVQECSTLEVERKIKLERIQQKTQQLHDLILKQISFKCLVERNKEAESKGLVPSPTSIVQLPFIVVSTHNKTLIDCSISNDKTEYVFNFNEKFQIQDDIDILKQMGLLLGLDKGNWSEADIRRVKNMVPKSLECYIDDLVRGDSSKFEETLNIKCEVDELGEGSGNGEELEEEDEYSMIYSDEGEEDQESGSDVDVN